MTCSRELQAILARVKDVETMRALRQDLLEQTEALQTIAACGQAALLAGPSIDGDMRLQGVVGNWIHGLLNWKKSAYVYGPPLGQVCWETNPSVVHG